MNDGVPDFKFTIRMNDRVLMYSTETTPRAQFKQAIGQMEDIQGLRKAAPETAFELIFGCNAI